MAKEPLTHYLVEFASRYSEKRVRTLTAGAALWRAEDLVFDAEALLELQNKAESKDIHFGFRSATYEIVAYYAVGYVTCLEWHARSRLIDLLLFLPNCIEPTDIRNIATLAISQMVAGGVTVPHLIGANTNVSQMGEYLKIFKRVFDALNIKIDIESEIRKTKTAIALPGPEADNSLYSAIDSLFNFRNNLVHEIDLSIIGHVSIRDMWPVETAIENGKAVVACIKFIESCITKHAPLEFPHRLREDSGEENELEKLQARISALESELKAKILEFDDGAEDWDKAVLASREAIVKEWAYLEQSITLQPLRHLGVREAFQTDLLRARLAYLLLLRAEFG